MKFQTNSVTYKWNRAAAKLRMFALKRRFGSKLRGNLMRRYRDPILFSLVLSCIVMFCSFVGTERSSAVGSLDQSINRHIAMLRSKEAQQKAAAAYWLGARGLAAERAIPALVDLLGDDTHIAPSRYRIHWL